MAGKLAATASMESRAVALLASGIAASKVAEALGVSASRISQLMEDQSFKEALASARFESLNRHNVADARLDSLESRIVEKIEDVIDMVHNPMQLTRMFSAVNMAKRRGTSSLADLPDSGAIVQLNMPTRIVNNFQLNISNQVIKAGGEDLLTMQPHKVQDMLARAKEISNDTSTTS